MPFLKTVILGMLVLVNTAAAQEARVPADELPNYLRNQGVRKHVRIEERADLRPLFVEAVKIAANMDPSCMISALSEMRIVRDQLETIAGYEAYADCEDAPTPAIALYFDVNHRFVGTFRVAD